MLAIIYAPVRARKTIVGVFTFVAGLYWVMLYLWPKPVDRQPDELPLNAVETVGFWLADSNNVVVSFTQILTAFLLGLGIFSLLRVHLGRIRKGHQDAIFSYVLIFAMLAMIGFGYADWGARQGEQGAMLDNRDNWTWIQYGRDFLFEGFLQQMDAAMFSIIAFYILSAAYRAFRVRSIEATILLSAALVVLLSLMGAVAYVWDSGVKSIANGNPFLMNFQLSEVSQWIRNTFQTSSLRGIQFGVGLGALAMGLRIWLSLEKTGGGN
jgi:TM2 domain-containing membrane protein YozV